MFRFLEASAGAVAAAVAAEVAAGVGVDGLVGLGDNVLRLRPFLSAFSTYGRI